MAIRHGSLAILAASVLLSVALFLRPLDARPQSSGGAAKIATVDMPKVLDRLNENADWEMRIGALSRSIAEEFQARQANLEAKIKELEALTDPAEQSAMREQLALERLRFEEWGRLKQMELDRERSLKWQTLYRAIRDEATRLAEGEGYEVVLVNDSLGPININRESELSQEQQVRIQIESRRLLFAAKATDITEQLVVRMNNARAVRP